MELSDALEATGSYSKLEISEKVKKFREKLMQVCVYSVVWCVHVCDACVVWCVMHVWCVYGVCMTCVMHCDVCVARM